MNYLEYAATVARSEAPLTHFVEYNTGIHSRVFRAICGASVHAREWETHQHANPSCPKCQELLAAVDAEAYEDVF